MSRRRPSDFVNWRLYRRALLVPVLALLVVLMTSFRQDVPLEGTLPPTLANDQASAIIDEAKKFQDSFPSRRPGSTDSIDSAQWMLDQFRQLDLSAKTVPTTTIDPATGKSVGLVNVEALLPGRTRELVVIYAHRDNSRRGQGSDALGQITLLALAKELRATRDLRRTYLFVSTDGATLNGGGARLLASRLQKRGAVLSIIGMDRLGASSSLRVDASASGEFAPPLGLVRAATQSVKQEGGDPSIGGLSAQLMRLAAPITLREHGQLLAYGLPALTITSGDDQLRRNGDIAPSPERLGSGARSVQRLLGTLEQVDQLQSAGKTWVAGDRRVYRGWALKLLVAALLIPVWVSAVDMLVRHRRGWNLPAAVGSIFRAMLAGVVSVGTLWLLGAIGLFSASPDRPPNPGSLDDVRVFALLVWLFVTTAAWLLVRGPDWRRQADPGRLRAVGPDTPELVIALVSLVVLTVLALAINAYAVIFILPALHLWTLLASWRVVFSPRRSAAIWFAGLTWPLLAVVVIGARSDTNLGAVWYSVQLVQTRTIPATLALLIGAGGALVAFLYVCTQGRVANPALPLLRSLWVKVYDGDLTLRDLASRLPKTVSRPLSAGSSTRKDLRNPTIRPSDRSKRRPPVSSKRSPRIKP